MLGRLPFLHAAQRLPLDDTSTPRQATLQNRRRKIRTQACDVWPRVRKQQAHHRLVRLLSSVPACTRPNAPIMRIAVYTSVTCSGTHCQLLRHTAMEPRTPMRQDRWDELIVWQSYLRHRDSTLHRSTLASDRMPRSRFDLPASACARHIAGSGHHCASTCSLHSGGSPTCCNSRTHSDVPQRT